MSSNSRSTAKNKVNNDPVDELKRRSRRRLVGSIALFLAAVIVVPALVENEPSQTPSDVELVVPERPSTDSVPEVAQVPAQPSLDAPKAVQEKAVAIAPVEPSAPAEPSAPETPQAEPKVAAKVETKVEPKLEPMVEPKPVVEDPIAAFAKTEVFWVQVAAVSDKKRADAMGQELSEKGFPAKVESAASSSSGTVYRIRVGPITAQAKADETKARLAAAGYTAGRVVK